MTIDLEQMERDNQGTYRQARIAYGRYHKSSREEARHVVTFSAWMIARSWKPTGGATLKTYLNRYLVKTALRYDETESKILLEGISLEAVREEVEKSIAAPLVEPQEAYVREVLKKIPSPDTYQECLVELWVGGFTYNQSLKRTNNIYRLLPRSELRAIANKTRRQLQRHFNVQEDTR